jgi:hypothetical protein
MKARIDCGAIACGLFGYPEMSAFNRPPTIKNRACAESYQSENCVLSLKKLVSRGTAFS